MDSINILSFFAQPTQTSLQSTEVHTAESLLFPCPRYCNNLKETPWKHAQVVQYVFPSYFHSLAARRIDLLPRHLCLQNSATGFRGHVLAAIFNMPLASVTYLKYATRFPDVVK